ncbi:MAG: hypothetical protein WBW81_01150 [Methylocella sp.]
MTIFAAPRSQQVGAKLRMSCLTEPLGSSGPAARILFKPSRRPAGANPVLSLMKAELPWVGESAYEFAYDMKNIAAWALHSASPLRAASGKKGA